MSIKRTIITTVVALALVAVVAPGVAQGTTIDDLLAQIAQLQSQLTALQGSGTTTTTGSGACAGVTFSRNLTVGATGADVKCLQTILNRSASTQVATTGAGSPGSETTYFGAKTLVAVKVFQQQQGFTPANQVGPMTRARLNTMLGGGSTTGTVTPTGAGLSVMLSSDNPSSNSVVAGQSIAPLAKLTFVNGDNAPVKVTGFKINRVGVSGDTDLTNVYLFDGATRLTDAASVSSGVISFNDSNGIFTVNAGSSKVITVAADIYSSAAAGTTLGVSLTSASNVITNASSVRGSFPITGNNMTVVAAPATFGTVVFTTATLAPSTSFTSSSPASIDPQTDYAVWKENVSVGNHAAKLTRISIREIGSINYTDIQNFRLFIDGVQAGSAVQNLDSNGYVTFDMTSNPVTLQTGSREIKVLADIVGGSNRNFTFSLRTAADATFIESQYNVNILPTVTAGAFSAQTTGYSSINSGTLTITKATDSPSADVVDLASNVTLAKFTVKAAGEKVKVDTLKVAVVCYDGGTTANGNVGYLRNGALYANGVQIGSTSNLYCTQYSTTYTTFNLGSSLVVDPLTPVTLEVKADIYDADGTDDVADNVASGLMTLKARIVASTGNGQGQTSLQTVAVPATAVDGNSLTVATGGLSLSKYAAFTTQAVVPPLTNQKIAHFTLTSNTTEAVNINTLEVNLNAIASSYATNLYVKYGNNTTTVKSAVTAQNTWYVNFQLPAGSTISLEVFADIKSTAAGTAYAGMYVAGTTANSATAVSDGTAATATDVQGQNISFTSGTFAEAFSNSPANQVVAGDQVIEAAKYQLTSSYQQYTVTEMRFSLGSDTIASAVVSASLKDCGTSGSTCTVIKENVPYDSGSDYFKFSGLNITVPANTTKTITLSYVLSPSISATAGSSDVDVKPTLTYVKRQDANGSVTEDSPLTYAANSTIVYKAIPVLSLNDLNNSTYMSNGAEQDLYSFKVTASKGDVSVKQFKLALTWSDGGTQANLALSNMKLLKNGSDITGSVSIVSEDGQSAESAGGVSEGDGTIVVVWDGSTADTIVSGDTVTYTLQGTPSNFRTGTGSSDTAGIDSVSLVFARDTAAQTASHNYLNANDNLTIVGLHDSAASATSAAEESTMIWSDMSAVGHGPSSGAVGTSSTNDWNNSYLLQSLLNPETWTR